MSEISEARERWISEKSRYEKLLERVIATLKQKLRSEGIFAHVTGRTKGTSNLLKKLIKKGYGYDKITDKAGARVAVRFRHEIEPVLKLIENSFEILNKDDKAETLGHNKVGYSGVHFDVRLKCEPEGPEADVRGLQCEIQVHTLCQSLWAEMDHELSYKPAQPIPEDVHRQIYLLNALLEVADRSFNSIKVGIAQLPGADLMMLLQNLERHFYRFTGETFDSELSQQVLNNVLSSYDTNEASRISAIIEEFVEENATRLQSLFNEYEKIDDRPLFLFQPESFVLFERLQRNPHVLQELWTRQYPRDELERLAVTWGTPLD